MNKVRGRPPKEVKADVVIPPIRVTELQKGLYQQAAKIAGLSLSEWIRQLADNASDLSEKQTKRRYK